MGSRFAKMMGMFLLTAGIVSIALGFINMIFIDPLTPVSDNDLGKGTIQSFAGIGSAIAGYLLLISASSDVLSSNTTRSKKHKLKH